MINLSEAKQYLRIDYNDEDKYIETLILTSGIYIDSMVGEVYKESEKLVMLADILQLKIVSDMYEMRSADIGSSSTRDRITVSILDKLSNYEGGD